MTEDRHRLILSCVHWDQFIFLIAEDEPMGAPAWTTSASRWVAWRSWSDVQDRAVAFRRAR